MVLLWIGVLMVVISVIPLGFGRQLASYAERSNRERMRRQGDNRTKAEVRRTFRGIYTFGGILFLVGGGVCILIARLSS